MPVITLWQGRCSIDLAAREIRVDGELRPLEPRPFEVLAYLIRHRHRVVGKWELLEAVWADEDTSPSALARAVMKLRQAIGDDEAQPLIRTIPRVGYRLVADMVEESSAPAPQEAMSAGDDAPVRVAILPVENATGDLALEWTELGLMSLVSNLANHQGRLLPIMPASVLAAQQGVKGAPQAEVEDMVRKATGAQVLVRSRLSRAGLMFQLDFECVGKGPTCHGRVVGPHASELGLRMLAPLLDLLAPGSAVEETCAQADPLALAAFARGLQAAALQRSTQAMHLLKMALDLMPDSVAVQLELLHVMSTLGDTEQAQPLMERLLEQAEARADLRLAARVHMAMGRLHLQHQSLRPAAFQLEKALRLMDEQAMPDEVSLALMLRAHVAMYMQDNPTMQRYLMHAGELCARTGNRLLQMRRVNTLAVVAGLAGDYAKAADLALEAAGLARELKATHALLVICVNSMEYLSVLGRWQEAVVYAEEAYALSVLLRDIPSLCGAAFGLCWIYRLTRSPVAAGRALAGLPAVDEVPASHQQILLHALGHHAAAAGNHAEAARHFARALTAAREADNWKNVYENLPWLICALVQSGQDAQALEELARAEHPPYSQHDELQRQLLHVRALLAHAQGARDQALGYLYRLLEGSAAPLWRAWAACDAAWLHAESGQLQSAWSALQCLPAGFGDLALSWAVRARIHAAQGTMEAAREAQARYMHLTPSSAASDFFRSLCPWYQDRRTDGPMPLAPWLPSRL